MAVKDINLILNNATNVTVTDVAPATYFFDVSERADIFVLNVDSSDEIKLCAMVAVQYQVCPFHNSNENVRMSEMYATFLSTATLNIRMNQSFFISIVLLKDNTVCNSTAVNSTMSDLRLKNVKISIQKVPPASTYTYAIGNQIDKDTVNLRSQLELINRNHFLIPPNWLIVHGYLESTATNDLVIFEFNLLK